MHPLDGVWRVSTRTGNNGACVEARYADSTVEVRDSKDRGGPTLTFSPATWTTFVASLHTKAAS